MLFKVFETHSILSELRITKTILHIVEGYFLAENLKQLSDVFRTKITFSEFYSRLLSLIEVIEYEEEPLVNVILAHPLVEDADHCLFCDGFVNFFRNLLGRAKFLKDLPQ